MSFVANQYNYATPLSSVQVLVDVDIRSFDGKFFALSNNTLDGTWYPITGDVGLWGTSVSDAGGMLSTPLSITVDNVGELNAVRVVGSEYSYPVDFAIDFYLGGVLKHTQAIVGNDTAERLCLFRA